MVVVKRPQIVHADGRHVFLPAQHRVAIRMPQVRKGLVGLIEPGLGRFQLARSLLADHLALGLDLARVEVGPAHPVGFNLKRDLPPARGKREPVVRVILARLGVGLPTRQKCQLIDLPLGKTLSPLEEHVLDEMRQPRLARRFIERTDRIKQVADDDRHPLARQDQGSQAVIQQPLENHQVAGSWGGWAGLETSRHIRAAPWFYDD